MSVQESNFLKWFGGIAGALIISFIISGIVMYRNVAVLSSSVEHSKNDINELRVYHKEDVKLIRADMLEIKEDNKEIKHDIKTLLAR